VSKLTVRIPTEPQRRILYELAVNIGLVLSWPGKGPAWWVGYGSSTARKVHGDPSNRMMVAMRRDGWIEELEPGTWRPTPEGEKASKASEGLTPIKLTLTEGDVLRALRKWYEPEWFLLEQLRVRGWRNRRLDALAVRVEGGPPSPRAFEIKTSRSDWAHELRDPDKRRLAVELANEFYFVVPQGLVPVNEVPDDCGLLEIGPGRRILKTREAPFTTSEIPDWYLLRDILKSVRARA
jgi:hypothetical protein